MRRGLIHLPVLLVVESKPRKVRELNTKQSSLLPSKAMLEESLKLALPLSISDDDAKVLEGREA